MSILSDKDIRQLCKTPDNSFTPMISPFIDGQIKTRTIIRNLPNTDSAEPIEQEQKIVSYGLSSGGYDVRLDRQFKIFTNVKSTVIDPLDIRDDYFVDHEGDFCIIPPNGYILGLTMETFHIPRDVMVIAVGKSTLARVGCIVNVTPIEPGWIGKVVIEVANASNVPVKVHADMGIAQFVFHRLSTPCDISYGDRAGKYQGQNSIVTAKV